MSDPTPIDARYAALVEETDVEWDAAWMELPQDICGVPVVHMTPRHYAELRIAKNPFLPGAHGDLTGGAVLAFLWVVYAHRVDTADPDEKRAQEAFTREYGRMDYTAAVSGIGEYVAATFRAFPLFAPDKPQLPTAGVLACWVHRLGAAYGWTPNVVLDMPIRQFSQLLRLQYRDEGRDLVHPADRMMLMEAYQ